MLFYNHCFILIIIKSYNLINFFLEKQTESCLGHTTITATKLVPEVLLLLLVSGSLQFCK